MVVTAKSLANILLALLPIVPLWGQGDPQGAHVNLYLPQLVDGGTSAQRWQTSVLLSNPSSRYPAAVLLDFLDNNGQALRLDFGAGPSSRLQLTLAPGASRTFRTTGISPTLVVGWAIGIASSPVQATILFRAIEQGAPRVEIAAPATLPTLTYRTVANADLGLAVANVYSGPITVSVRAVNQSGSVAGTGRVNLAALGHTSFNLRAIIPSLPANFEGSSVLSATTPNTYFVAWALNSTSGLLSSLPSGETAWPVAHIDRIQLAYWKILNVVNELYPAANVFSQLPRLNIVNDSVINAAATPDNTIHISLALAELISDSPSELAFIVGHEIAHLMQFRNGNRSILHPNPGEVELDADGLGMLFSLFAGFDPYGGAGVIAKVAMASGTADLISQVFLKEFDIHRSDNTRIKSMFELLSTICGINPQACAEYRQVVHPHFPPNVPLASVQNESSAWRLPEKSTNILAPAPSELLMPKYGLPPSDPATSSKPF